MKALVVYYSRTGNTRKVGEEIARNLKADLDEVKDKKKRNGVVGYIIGGFHGLFKKQTKIEFKKNPGNYDLVIVGTPIWAGLTPAIRTYLIKNKGKIRKVSFFCTRGGSNPKNVFEEMEKLAYKPVDRLALLTKEVAGENYKEKVKEFCKKIK